MNNHPTFRDTSLLRPALKSELTEELLWEDFISVHDTSYRAHSSEWENAGG